MMGASLTHIRNELISKEPVPTLTMILPLLPGKTETWWRFCQELSGTRQDQYEVSRRRLGIVQESFAPVETSLGTAVLITIEAEDVGQALTRLAASNSPFDRWYKEKWRDIHGFWLTDATGERRNETERPEPKFVWKAEEKHDA